MLTYSIVQIFIIKQPNLKNIILRISLIKIFYFKKYLKSNANYNIDKTNEFYPYKNIYSFMIY